VAMKKCFYPSPVDREYSEEMRLEQQKCQEEQETERIAYENAKLQYEGKKYAIIAGFNLLILLFALFATFTETVVAGMFYGAAIATFAATIRYFDTKSKIGFIILVIIFLMMLYFVNKQVQGYVKKSKRK